MFIYPPTVYSTNRADKPAFAAYQSVQRRFFALFTRK